MTQKKDNPLNLSDGALLLAPIAGYSDAPLRTMSLSYGAEMCFTEMVSAKGIYYKNENTAELLYLNPSEKNTAVQIFGSDPDIMAEVVNYDCLKDFKTVDINMGCPVPKIVKNGEGSALLCNPDLIHKLVKSVKAALGQNRNLTVKIRSGFYSGYENAAETAAAIEAGGACMVTIHGRTREQYYSGKADLEIIKKVKSAVKIPVAGNGDVVDKASYLRMREMCGVDYVMIGRGAIGRPYIFSEILGLPFEFNIKQAVFTHINLLGDICERAKVNTIKRCISFYMKGQKNSKTVKEAIFKAESINDIIDILESI